MTQMLHTILESVPWDRLIRRHPCLFGVMLLVGLPLGMLLAVSLLTLLVTLPLALVLGWL